MNAQIPFIEIERAIRNVMAQKNQSTSKTSVLESMKALALKKTIGSLHLSSTGNKTLKVCLGPVVLNLTVEEISGNDIIVSYGDAKAFQTCLNMLGGKLENVIVPLENNKLKICLGSNPKLAAYNWMSLKDISFSEDAASLTMEVKS